MRELFYIFKIDKSQILSKNEANLYYQKKFNNITFKNELKKSINTLFPSKKVTFLQLYLFYLSLHLGI